MNNERVTDLTDATLEENESPIACDLSGLDTHQRRRYETLIAEMGTAVQEVRELPDGYAIRIPSEGSIFLAIAEWITLERLCCPFLRFVLEIDSEGGPTWLRLTGREGVKEFLRAELGARGRLDG